MFKKLRGNLILIGLLGLVWLWIRRPKSPEEGRKLSTIEIPVETAEIVVPEEVQPPKPASKIGAVKAEAKTVTRSKKAAAKADDLTVISGIGPKISGVLNAAGITRYTQLAGADVAQLWQILEKAGIRLAKPENWIEQAKTLSKE